MYDLGERIRPELLHHAGQTSWSILEMPLDESKAIRQTIREKFAPSSGSGRFWTHFTGAYGRESVLNPEAWQWTEQFLADKPVFLLLDEGILPTIFQFESGHHLIAMLRRIGTWFEFYIGDPEGKFLIGFDHENALYTFGTAADWLTERCEDIFTMLNIEPTTIYVSTVAVECWGK